MLRSVAADVIPRGFGTDKEMYVDLNTGITVDAAESHPVYSAFMGPTECGSTGRTEAQAPSRLRLIAGEAFGTAGPCERIRRYLGVCRSRAAERLAAP
jgi:hypothetical protein